MMHEHEHEQLHELCCDHTHVHEQLHEHECCDAGEALHDHAHTHEHEHSHEHVHQDGAVHAHAHSHSHSHAHSHSHSHGEVAGFDSLDQARALMAYMLDHNRHHAEELHELCHKLEASGKADAAQLIHDAVEHFSSGNMLLESALEKMKQE